MTSISISNDHSAQSAKIPPALHGWMKSRLANPLLRLDVSGLCWGICRYWEASVCRARIWAKLKRKHDALVAGGVAIAGARVDDDDMGSSVDEEMRKPLRRSDLRAIVPHLERTTMVFSYGAKKRESKLLLSCPLTLDEWTGEPQLKPEISISIPDLADTKRLKVERDVKRLFRNLLKEGRRSRRKGDDHDASNNNNGDGSEAEAIVKATEGVMGVLFGIDVLTAKSNGTGKQ